MTAHRDPLSVHYDDVTSPLLVRAARASRQSKSVRAWVVSPRGEFGRRDQSGRTAHERAFVRSAYYLVRGQFIRTSIPIEWSLKLTWGDDSELRPSRPGHLARPVTVRLYRRSEAEVRGRSYISDQIAGMPRAV